jgi:two-component system, chemotaxis family, sensor kinase CheA
MAEPDPDLDQQLLAQMREDFISDSKEILEKLGPVLIGLERGDPELIHTTFRAMHTLKGTAAFVGLESIRRLAHKMEDVFGAVRSGALPVTPELIDLAFAAVQLLTDMCADVSHGGSGELDIELLVARLETAVQSATPTDPRDAPRPESIRGLRVAVSQAPPGDSRVRIEEQESSPEFGAIQMPDDEARLGTDYVHGETRIPDGAPDAAGARASGPDSAQAGHPVPDVRISDAVSVLPAQADAVSEIRPQLMPELGPASAPRAGGLTSTAACEPEATLRVEVGTLDTLMTLVGELVTARNALASSAERLGDETLLDNTAVIHRLARQLQAAVSSVRLMPVERLFSRFIPVVRNLARDHGKQVRLVIEGSETPLDRTVCERMYDPLVHLLRNAVDHGLEPAEVRRAAGKPAEGLFRLSAERRGDDVYLRLSDDGAGIDPARLRRVAVGRRLLSVAEAKALTDEQALRLIFRTGFSTAATVTDLSGRGVGLDVVVDQVRRLRGHIDVETQAGRGTTFVIRLPLTMAILQVLLARVDEHVYALPLYALRETFRLSPVDIEALHGQPAVFIHGRPLPVYCLADWLGAGEADHAGRAPTVGATSAGVGATLGGRFTRSGPAVVVRLTRGDEAWLVDELVGKQQVVIKPLSPYLGAVRGVEGAAILPDGSVTLVLDLEGLSRRDTDGRS